MPTVKPVPEGYHTITPYLSVSGGEKAIEFYFGHSWYLSTHKEDLSEEEMKARGEKHQTEMQSKK